LTECQRKCITICEPKSTSSITQYVTLQKSFSHPSLVI
jgi:hypothetical protein